MKKDFRLTLEKLDSRLFLSANPWYIDAIKAPIVWDQLNDTNKSVLSKRSNLIEVRIKDSLNQLESIAFKAYLKDNYSVFGCSLIDIGFDVS